MSSDVARYGIGDLAGLVGATPRTIRYYVAQGLLPPPVGAGPGAHYTDAHLARLRLIRRLQRQHQPLSDIRQRLASLGAEEVSALVADDEQAAPPDSALEYLRTVLAGPVTPSSPAASASSPVAGPSPVPVPAVRLPRAFSRLAAASMPRMLEAEPPAVLASRVAEAAPDYAATTEVPPGDAGPAPEQRSQWDRIGLTPNIEIHVRRPLGRLENRRVERLITIARQLLREEQP